MENFGIYATMKAQEGKEQEAETFLKGLVRLVEMEGGTKRWFALKYPHGTFAIFDTFNDQQSRESHLNGEVARQLQSRMHELFDGGISLVTVDIVAEHET